MFLKVLGAFLVVLSCSRLGVYMAARLSERRGLLKKIRVMVIHLRGEILYANAPLYEGFQKAGRRAGGREGLLFETVSEQLLKEQGKEFFAIWQEAVTSYLPQTPLTKEEGEQLLPRRTSGISGSGNAGENAVAVSGGTGAGDGRAEPRNCPERPPLHQCRDSHRPVSGSNFYLIQTGE